MSMYKLKKIGLLEIRLTDLRQYFCSESREIISWVKIAKKINDKK